MSTETLRGCLSGCRLRHREQQGPRGEGWGSRQQLGSKEGTLITTILSTTKTGPHPNALLGSSNNATWIRRRCHWGIERKETKTRVHYAITAMEQVKDDRTEQKSSCGFYFCLAITLLPQHPLSPKWKSYKSASHGLLLVWHTLLATLFICSIWGKKKQTKC